MRFWLLIVGILLLGSCSKGEGPEKVPPLIDRNREMSIQRTDLGHTATVKFFTVYPAYCKVEYWRTDLGDNPPASRRKRKACFRKSPVQSHFVRLENLARGKPLYVRLLTSSSDASLKSFNDLLVLKETTSPYSYFPPVGYNKNDDKKDIKVTVIKANLTQASASVYSNRVDKKELERHNELFLFPIKKEGCAPFRIPHPGFLLPPRNVRLRKVYSTGYYSTAGVVIDNKLGVFLLDYTGKLEPARRWVFKFDFEDSLKSVEHEFSAPPEFRSAKMTSPNEHNLQKHDLMDLPDPIAINPAEGLEFSWEARNTQETDYFEILIGKPSRGASVKCRYSLKTKILSLSSEDLAPLAGGMYDVIVSLNRREISKSSDGHAVFLHTHDWRHLALKFL